MKWDEISHGTKHINILIKNNLNQIDNTFDIFSMLPILYVKVIQNYFFTYLLKRKNPVNI